MIPLSRSSLCGLAEPSLPPASHFASASAPAPLSPSPSPVLLPPSSAHTAATSAWASEACPPKLTTLSAAQGSSSLAAPPLVSSSPLSWPSSSEPWSPVPSFASSSPLPPPLPSLPSLLRGAGGGGCCGAVASTQAASCSSADASSILSSAYCAPTWRDGERRWQGQRVQLVRRGQAQQMSTHHHQRGKEGPARWQRGGGCSQRGPTDAKEVFGHRALCASSGVMGGGGFLARGSHGRIMASPSTHRTEGGTESP